MTPQRAASDKPVDVGSGTLAASLGGTNAALLSVLAAGPGGELVELSALPPFDEAGRGDPAAARRYRALMVEDRFACVHLESEDGVPVGVDAVDLEDALRPRWRGHVRETSVDATAQADGAALLLEWQLGDGAPPLRVRFSGRLDEPAFAEITDTDPPPPSAARTALVAAGTRLRVSAPPLGTAIDVTIVEPRGSRWHKREAEARADVPAGATRITIELAVAGTAAHDAEPPRPSAGQLPHATRRIVERALAYVRGCTTLRVAPDERVVLADHRILPLSWTRDAYYQALLLLVADGQGDRERVADHLRWLWRRCERPDGRWVRSHRADGRRKDRAFQADQQLYPLLELTDFARAAETLPAGVDWQRAVPHAWRAVLEAVDPRTGLIATAENAADDATSLPFITSSQILLWYVAERLGELALARDVGVDPDVAAETARRVRDGVRRHLTVEGRWAYSTDGRGQSLAYHDANDLPVALAPLWGYCEPDDAVWRATMAFAFSEANAGYAPGTRGGLGSAHTPGAWTLGDIQGWLMGRATANDDAMEAAASRLVSVAFDDGMLPEAYATDAADPVRVRHWFAWPGAAWAALVLLDARSLLGTLLPATRPPTLPPEARGG